MPRVSIVIPTYNRGRFLGEAVASALAQTYRDHEIIVVDDGSTDNTREIASGFPPEVRYFRQENQGVSAARNRGIELARGEYVCFLDSDDMLLPEALEKNVSLMDKYPDAGFSYGQALKIDERGRLFPVQKTSPAGKAYLREGKEQIAHLLFRCDVRTLTALVRRRCLYEVGLFDTKLRLHEDLDLWLRLSSKFNVGYVGEPLGKVRVHPQNSLGGEKFDALEIFQSAFVEKGLALLKSEPEFNVIKRRAYFGLYCYLAGEAARKHQRMVGLKYIVKAFTVYPLLTVRWDGCSFLLTTLRSFLPGGFAAVSKQALAALKWR
jgi:glycosyltransferase involved in cell wall biosynthesis